MLTQGDSHGKIPIRCETPVVSEPTSTDRLLLTDETV